ncbi:hypothetical protein M0208_18265 [Sphingomonas sp. SUN019]|uniref:hypothetical protein n=1 Tax=Sphingomonas sp. SUN019 TaxID=2937788 RepID=UPI0021645E82|nr:hypothetical protein [Sphingomonas sp. SUN019]UVO52358.1 hypothetical protein M0208_18265 [Sphingomonas sp. SUN019]
MIALLLALAADPPKPTAIDGLPIGAIGRQALPAKGCAAYFFTATTKRDLVAMATADPATLRFAIDGATIDVARASQSGTGGYGFAASTVYRGGDVAATLDMTITTRADLTSGAAVPEAALRIDRPGKDGLVVPLQGLIGCAT